MRPARPDLLPADLCLGRGLTVEWDKGMLAKVTQSGLKREFRRPLSWRQIMASCLLCGASFSPQVPGWGDAACGDCIATHIEMALTGRLPLSERKPLRRAGVIAAGSDVPFTVSEPEEQGFRAA